jgi:hypothetical protein
MIDSDSYLARPPAIITLRQRLCLEAISFSINSIATDIQSVRSIAAQHPIAPPKLEDFSQRDKISLCSCLWSIVDQTHMLCKVLKELNLGAPYVDSFIDNHAPVVSNMPNKMDHLHSQLTNIISSKKSRPTVFGCLSYFVFNSTGRTEHGQQYGIIVMIHFGI